MTQPDKSYSCEQIRAIEPMRFHGPGWTLDLSERDEDGEVIRRGEHYWVWAPQTELVRDETRFPGMWSTGDGAWREDAKRPRAHWAASWQSGDGNAGDFIKGRTAADVLYIFPDRIARRFRSMPELARSSS